METVRIANQLRMYVYIRKSKCSLSTQEVHTYCTRACGLVWWGYWPLHLVRTLRQWGCGRRCLAWGPPLCSEYAEALSRRVSVCARESCCSTARSCGCCSQNPLGRPTSAGSCSGRSPHPEGSSAARGLWENTNFSTNAQMCDIYTHWCIISIC